MSFVHIPPIIVAILASVGSLSAEAADFGSSQRAGERRKKLKATNPPRVREYDFTFVVDGQDGRLAWGHSASAAATTNEPFAWAISADNKSIVGADTDGYFLLTVLAPDRMEMCYTHNGLSPSKSIVATCFVMERAKK